MPLNIILGITQIPYEWGWGLIKVCQQPFLRIKNSLIYKAQNL